jgi:hypothetical protein
MNRYVLISLGGVVWCGYMGFIILIILILLGLLVLGGVATIISAILESNSKEK